MEKQNKKYIQWIFNMNFVANLRTGLGTVHDGVTLEDREWVRHFVQSLLLEIILHVYMKTNQKSTH